MKDIFIHENEIFFPDIAVFLKLKNKCSIKLQYRCIKYATAGGDRSEPGTEKRCSHNLQNGPVKRWTAVFVTIHISVRHRDQLL